MVVAIVYSHVNSKFIMTRSKILGILTKVLSISISILFITIAINGFLNNQSSKKCALKSSECSNGVMEYEYKSLYFGKCICSVVCKE